jgi:hypothetical protein
MLFIKGQAETGKSTLLKFVSRWYNTEDVGILASNIEEKFGASMIANKYIVVGDDLQENFSLDQALFQNMTTGGEVSLPVKNKMAMVIPWKAQMLLSGNVLPGYKDNAGSYSRRLLIIYYSTTIKTIDTKLPEKLAAETAASIVKCNRLYRNMVRRMDAMSTRPEELGGPKSFWETIPEEFRIEKKNVAQASNAYMAFLNSGQLAFGPDLYMPKDNFVQHLMNYCQANGIQKPRFQPSHYEGSFVQMQIQVTTRQRAVYPRTPDGATLEVIWVVGCDLISAESLARGAAGFARAANEASAAAANEGAVATVAAAPAAASSAPVPGAAKRPGAPIPVSLVRAAKTARIANT